MLYKIQDYIKTQKNPCITAGVFFYCGLSGIIEKELLILMLYFNFYNTVFTIIMIFV